MRNGLSKDLIARVLGGAPKYTIAELEAENQEIKSKISVLNEQHSSKRNVPNTAFINAMSCFTRIFSGRSFSSKICSNTS